MTRYETWRTWGPGKTRLLGVSQDTDSQFWDLQGTPRHGNSPSPGSTCSATGWKAAPVGAVTPRDSLLQGTRCLFVFHFVILLNKLCDLYLAWALIHSPNSYSSCNSWLLEAWILGEHILQKPFCFFWEQQTPPLDKETWVECICQSNTKQRIFCT